MKTNPVLLHTAFALAALFSTRAALASDDIRVGVVVEVTAAGRKIAPPAPNKPVYYEPLAIGYRVMGGVLVDWQRPPPPPADVKNALVQALAAQGYLVAPAQTPASLVLAFRWGVVDPEMRPFFDPKDDVIDKIEPVNENNMLALVVGDGWRDIYPTDDPNSQELVTNLTGRNGSRYFLIVSALDAQAFANHQQVLLWRAHVTTLYWGHYLDQVLGTMITGSAPLFGRETNRPQIITAPAAPLSVAAQ